MLGDSASRRRARRVLGPWLLLGVAAWLALDNGPALLDEWRLREGVQSGTATIVSIGGARPQRAVRRLWDDLFWERGRRVTYEFAAARDSSPMSASAFLTHRAADNVQQGGTIGVRYVAANPAIHRIEGEPGLLLLTFRILVALTLAMLGIILLRGQRSRSKAVPASARLSA